MEQGDPSSSTYVRILSSWETAWNEYDLRISSGIQPLLPGVNFKTMLYGNVFYLVICALLVLLMSKKENGFRLKKIIIVYNSICVLLAGYVVVGILLFKIENPGKFACNPLQTNARGQQVGTFYKFKFLLSNYTF